jgi:uncharacterized membrane protein YheB (UPF0754 family)
LFNPKQKRWGLQGAIPKNQARLARSIGRTVGERLLTPEDVQRELARPELRETFEASFQNYLPSALGRFRGPVARAVAPAVWEKLHDQLPDVVQRLDLAGMVERKLTQFSADHLEEILRGVLHHELNMIITSGFVLGALIGVGTFFLSHMLGLA